MKMIYHTCKQIVTGTEIVFTGVDSKLQQNNLLFYWEKYDLKSTFTSL